MDRLFALFSGHRIVATATPWVTTEYPLDGQPSAFKESVGLQSFLRILGTGRAISTTCWCKGRNEILVPFNQ